MKCKLAGVVQLQRTFPTEFLKEGYPNLLVEPPGMQTMIVYCDLLI